MKNSTVPNLLRSIYRITFFPPQRHFYLQKIKRQAPCEQWNISSMVHGALFLRPSIYKRKHKKGKYRNSCPYARVNLRGFHMIPRKIRRSRYILYGYTIPCASAGIVAQVTGAGKIAAGDNPSSPVNDGCLPLSPFDHT